MYKTLLILKYLRKRRIAWVSLIAVMLCTAMVLVVISVMGGWLRMFREQFHHLAGDVTVDARSMVGFPYYEEMIQRITKLPEVHAAAPIIKTFGLGNFRGTFREGVQVLGYPRDIGRVNGFVESLHRKNGQKDLTFDLWPDVDYQPPFASDKVKQNEKKLQRDVRTWPGMIVGTGTIGLHKDEHGNIERGDYIYKAFVDLTVLPLDPDSSVVNATDKAREFFWIIDDSRTKVYPYDNSNVYVDFDVLQRLLAMDARQLETTDGKTITRPARASSIQVALKPGADLAAATQRIRQAVDAVAQEKNLNTYRYPYKVETWEEINQDYIGAIENEKGLVTILFGIISLVAVFQIFCIFYMIVVEKTRDIGIIKSVGATSSGVAGIFLGYGLAIGIVGAGLGLLLGYLVVHYINQLHAWLAHFGIVVWNPKTYLFDTIPNTMNPKEVAVIIIVAIVASVCGAVVPAIRAAGMHPVEALRWE